MTFRKMALSLFMMLMVPSQAFAQTVASAEDSVPGGTLMLVAYLGLWALIIGFLIVLSRRQASLDADIAILEKRLDELLLGNSDGN